MRRLPAQIANPGLAALIQGGGFRSLERFAQIVNARGWQLHGLKLAYDHVTVKRWLAGSVCQNADVVAAVVSEAWGVPVPVHVLWPELRDGAGPVPAHLQVWVANRTLDDLGAFIGSDMLTRREVLAGSVATAAGDALVNPLSRWLTMPSVGLAPRARQAQDARRIGVGDVESVEQATRRFAGLDAEIGGGLSREAAVGQLKYAVDLVRYASYSDAVGNRLLAAVAGLAGLVGWMCHDCGMPGPAQRYLTYGLQAARESTDPRAALLVIRILADMAQQARRMGQPATAVRLIDLALSQLPQDRRRFNVIRAMLSGQRAFALAHVGPSTLAEVRSAVGLAADLHDSASIDERAVVGGAVHRSLDLSRAELAATTASAYLVLAQEDRRLASEAVAHTEYALAHSPRGQGRNRTLSQIRLARARFVAGEPDQACADGDEALAQAGSTTSWMVTSRLRELYLDTEPFREQPLVRELRDRLRTVVRGPGCSGDM